MFVTLIVTLWVKVMAPSDKKDFQRFRDLVFKVVLPQNYKGPLAC
jgi:hypothetical protein